MSVVVTYLESHPGLFVAIGGIATVLGVVVIWIIAYFKWRKARPEVPRSGKRFWLILAGSVAVALSVGLVFLWPKSDDEPAKPPAPDPAIGHETKKSEMPLSPELPQKKQDAPKEKTPPLLLGPLTMSIVQKFEGHTDIVRSVALSGDGKYVLTGSDGKTAILWEVKASPAQGPIAPP